MKCLHPSFCNLIYLLLIQVNIPDITNLVRNFMAKSSVQFIQMFVSTVICSNCYANISRLHRCMSNGVHIHIGVGAIYHFYLENVTADMDFWGERVVLQFDSPAVILQCNFTLVVLYFTIIGLWCYVLMMLSVESYLHRTKHHRDS
jgi:hypothetical protein